MLAASLCAGGAPSGVAQEAGRPTARDVPPRKVIRTQRLRVPADLFVRRSKARLCPVGRQLVAREQSIESDPVNSRPPRLPPPEDPFC